MLNNLKHRNEGDSSTQSHTDLQPVCVHKSMSCVFIEL